MGFIKVGVVLFASLLVGMANASNGNKNNNNKTENKNPHPASLLHADQK